MLYLAVCSLAIDPANPEVLYAGTGEGFYGSDSFVRGLGIFKSVDAGTNAAMEFVVVNQGSAAAQGTWQDRVYLSLDNRITPDDILVAQGSNGAALQEGESYRTIVDALGIPNRFPPYLHIVARFGSSGSGSVAHAGCPPGFHPTRKIKS